MIDSLFFLIKSAFKSIFKNWLLTIASITVLTVSLVTLGSFLLIIGNVNLFIDEIGDESQVVLYLDDGVTTAQITGINDKLHEISNIGEITYKTKEMILKEYKESLGADSWLLDDLSADTFRDSITFSIRDLEKFDQTIYEVEKIEGIARVKERRDVIERIVDIREVLMFMSVWIVLLFLIISVLVITNSVKVSVYSKKHELNLMKYIGATDAFIQAPYFLEGIIVGLIAGCLALVAQHYVYANILAPILADLGFFTPLALSGIFRFFVIGFLAVGAIVGTIGSALPVKKYLNV